MWFIPACNYWDSIAMKYRVWFLALSTIVVLLGVCSAAMARLLDVSLSELVAQSDVIVYGVVVNENGKNQGTVAITPKTVLKGAKGEDEKRFIVCNIVGNTESLDLREVHQPVVVFAKKNEDCLMPVHGISSTIVVNKGLAATASIVDQPTQQSISEFLKRIRRIVNPDGSS